MIPSPWKWNQKMTCVLMLLTFSLLMLFLAPTASARTTDRNAGVDGQISRYEANRITADLSDGYVTDTDGIIGNVDVGRKDTGIGDINDGTVDDTDGRIGMDHSYDRDPVPVDPGTGGINGNNGGIGNNMGQGIGGMDNADGILGENGITNRNSSGEAGTPGNGAPTESDTANGENSSNVLGWIIAIIVALAVLLVILALLPKKERSGSR